MRKEQSHRIHTVDEAIRQVDAWCVEKKLPPLSAIISRDDSSDPIAVFWESVVRYDLRRPGESDEQLVARIRDECFAAEYPPLWRSIIGDVSQ